MAVVKRKTKWNPSLHPRDAKGRFTRSSTRMMKGSDTTRARSALSGFSPAKVGAQADARAWIEKRTGKPLSQDSALSRYLAGEWRTTNPAIRSQKTPPPGVAEIDAEFGELDEDVMLRRQVPLQMFAHIPIKDLEGMKVRDAAYASTSLDTPDAGPSAADAVTLHIAAAAGTLAYVNAPDGEILLARDTEIAITRAEPNGRGGWDLYGAIIPKTATKRPRPTDRQDGETSPAPSGTSGPDGATATDGNRDAGGGDSGGRGGADDSPRAAAAQDDAPARKSTPRAGSTGGRRAQSDAGDGDQKTGDETPAAGTSAPDDAGEPGPLPDEGPLGEFTRLDRERIRVAVEDHAARMFTSPMIGGSQENVARYVSEGPLGKLNDREGLARVWKAVDQVLEDRPELMTRPPAESERAAAARAERVNDMASQAAARLKDGDYAGALDLIDQAETIAPDHRAGKGLQTRSWDELRGIVRRRQEKDQAAGDATPAGDASDQVDADPTAVEGGPWIAPGTGALAELTPADRERVRIAVEDNAARIFRTPMMGGTPGNVARYVAEGRDLSAVTNQYGFRPTVDAVSQILADRPELMRRTDEEVEAARAARKADANARAEAAGNAINAGDFDGARTELDAGEAIDPDWTLDVPGPAVGWAAVRRIVDDAERDGGGQQQTGDAAPAADTSAPTDARAALAASVESGVAEREAIGNGGTAQVELVTFNDGGRAVFKHTYSSQEEGRPSTEQQDAEELGALALEAFGVRAPALHRTGPADMYLEYIDGRTGMEAHAAEGVALLDRVYASDAGRLMGLADAVMSNIDRNGGNWLVGGDGELIGIDHGYAFAYPDDLRDPIAPTAAIGIGFSAAYVARGANGLPTGWGDHDISPGDIATIRGRLTALRPEFERLGRADWHDTAMGRLDAIGAHATGDRDRIATGDAAPAAGTSAPDAPVEMDAVDPTPTDAPGTPDAPAGAGTVAGLQRNDYVSVTGREPGRDGERTATGYVASVIPTGDGDAQMVSLTEHPGHAGRRDLLVTAPGTPVTPATPPANPKVVLWRSKRNGRPVANPGQAAIVRGDVVRDAEREEQVRQAIADLAAVGQPAPAASTTTDAPATPDAPTGGETPAAGTSAPAAPAAPARVPIADVKPGSYARVAGVDMQGRKTETAGWVISTRRIRWSPDGRTKMRDMVEVRISEHRPDSTNPQHRKMLYLEPKATAEVRELSPPVMHNGELMPAGWLDAAELLVTKNRGGYSVTSGHPGVLHQFKTKKEAEDWIEQSAAYRRGWVGDATPAPGASAPNAADAPTGDETPAAGTSAPEAPTVAELEPGDYVTVTDGTRAGTSTGYVNKVTQTGKAGEYLVHVTDYPDGHGRRNFIALPGTDRATLATPPDPARVTLWKDARTGRPVLDPTRRAVTSGQVVRDTEREELARTAVANNTGRRAAPGAAAGTPADGTSAPTILANGRADAPPAALPDDQAAIRQGDFRSVDISATRLVGHEGFWVRVPRQLHGAVAGPGTWAKVARVERVRGRIGGSRVEIVGYDANGGMLFAETPNGKLRAAAGYPAGSLVHNPAPATPAAVVPEGLHGIVPPEGWGDTGPDERSVRAVVGVGRDFTFRRQNQQIEGPTHRQARKMAERRQMALEDARKYEAAGNDDRAIDLDMYAIEIEGELRSYGFDPETGRPARKKPSKTGDRKPAAGTSAPVADQGEEKRRKDYERGWNASRRNANLEHADDRGEADAWYEGYGDHATGRPKWTSMRQVTPEQVQDAAAKLGPEETDRILGGRAISGAERHQLADLVDAAAELPDDEPDDDPDTGDGGGGTPTPTGPDTAPAGPAAAPSGPAQQADVFGGASDFMPASRSSIGLADRPDVGRERAIAAVQQLGMFDVSDQQQMDGQMAMLDSLLAMPEVDTPPAPSAPEPAAAPDAPASIVPDDLSDWDDEQLGELFRTVTGVHDLDQVDEDGAARIMAEWERREAGMANLVASVPEDLTTLPEDDVMGLYARVSSELGTMDHPTVQRLEAELDRRQEEERLAEENAPKRALLARPLSELTDDEIETAAGYASDLDDADALARVVADMERRDHEREVAAERARIEREAQEAAEREAARQAAVEAERRAAAEHAAAQRDRMIDALAAAQDAAIVPAFDNTAMGSANTVLGEDGIRALLGDQVVDQWIADLTDGGSNTSISAQGHSVDRHWTAIQRGLIVMPAGDRIRVVSAAADQEGAKEFADWDDRELHTAVSQGMFSAEPLHGPAPKRELGRRAGREQNRRKIQKLQQDNAREFRQYQTRAMAADPVTLTDAELQVAPALVAATPGGEGFDTPGRLGALRAEAQRREVEAGRMAEEKAVGPAGPARYLNPVQEYGYLRQMVQGTNERDRAAQDRLRRAQAVVFGLPEDADAKAIKAAERKDPRPVADQAAAVMAWFRHLGKYEGVDQDGPDYYRGKPDEDVPDTPAPLPPANISKPDEVWQQILATARADLNDGRFETARRVVQAIARTYRIPAEDAEDDMASIQRLQDAVAPATHHDQRTPKQRAADFIAQFRALAADDDIDPSDTLRYGPPDKGTRRTSRVLVKQSTPEQERRIDELVARGWDWLDAYAEVHGVDRADVEGRSAGGRSGMTEKQIKEAYAEYVELQYLAAEAATNGFLLNDRAQQINAQRTRRSETLIDPRDLFSGPWSTARANASEELLRWWGENQRMSYADFRAQLIGGDAARASRERLISAGKGNEFA